MILAKLRSADFAADQAKIALLHLQYSSVLHCIVGKNSTACVGRLCNTELHTDNIINIIKIIIIIIITSILIITEEEENLQQI